MNYKKLSEKNLCVSLANQSFEQCLDIVQKVSFAELRLDMLMLKDEEYKQLFSYNTKFIATCRYGETATDERIAVLKNIIDLGANFVDIELELDNKYFDEILRYAKQKNCKVIVSYHNFERTPAKTELQEIIDTAKSKSADYVKIACYAITQKDVLKILSLYENNNNLIAFAMGEVGRISRVASLYMGAEFTYVASENGQETAMGQLSINEMKQVFSLI